MSRRRSANDTEDYGTCAERARVCGDDDKMRLSRDETAWKKNSVLCVCVCGDSGGGGGRIDAAVYNCTHKVVATD